MSIRATFVAAGGGSDNSFCLYFKILQNPDQTSINVLPDFMPPGKLAITRGHASSSLKNGSDNEIGLGAAAAFGAGRSIRFAVPFLRACCR
jgi:hypothetical protein